jgi:crotonobetainyl-CoA:carnitine CoA-transferase CaiB-like acyl-CoA transferase
VTLDLNDERGKQALRDLLATCDVLVENYTPRVLEQLGLSFPEVQAIRPDLVMVRMPGFGLSGPWRDNPAFAFVIEDASGLTWLTGYPDATPLSPYCLGDPSAGLHALVALLLALEHRRRTGEGVLVEAAMVEAAMNVAAEQVVEFSAYGTLLARDGNRGPAAAPQNVYRAQDASEGDSWVAIAIETAEQWLALHNVLDLPGWAADDALLSLEGRRRHSQILDEHLAAWCGQRSSDEIVEQLWAVGVPVAKVLQPHQQSELAQLKFRRFFEAVEHPVTGTARHSTLPMRLSAGPEHFHVRHAPLFGEHTRTILASVGLSPEEIDALEEDRVSATVPKSATGVGR